MALQTTPKLPLPNAMLPYIATSFTLEKGPLETYKNFLLGCIYLILAGVTVLKLRKKQLENGHYPGSESYEYSYLDYIVDYAPIFAYLFVGGIHLHVHLTGKDSIFSVVDPAVVGTIM